jgi:hypothetical protein
MKKILYIIPLLFFIAACGSGISEKEARVVATNAALGTPPPPKYQTAAAIYLNLTLTSTPTAVPYGAPTMSMIDFSYTQIAYQQGLNLTQDVNQKNMVYTQQANDLAMEQQKLAVERASIQATRDANYLNKTATADANTAIAYQDMMTAQSANTATAQANETKAASTMIASTTTALAAPIHDAWTQTAVAGEIRIQEAEAQQVELARDRQIIKNFGDAVLPWTLTVIALFLIGLLAYIYLQTRIFTRDEYGRTPAIMKTLPNGDTVYTRLELLTGPHVRITKLGEIITPEPADRAEQSDVTRRAQVTEAIASLPLPYARNAQGMMKSEFGGGSSNPSVQILSEARALSPVLDEAESKLLEE